MKNNHRPESSIAEIDSCRELAFEVTLDDMTAHRNTELIAIATLPLTTTLIATSSTRATSSAS